MNGKLQYIQSKDHYNVDQDIIHITEDRVRLIISQYNNIRSESSNIWPTIGFIVTVLSVFFTTNFRDFMGVSANTWSVLMGLVLLISIISLIFKFISFIRMKDKIGIDYVVSRMKNSAPARRWLVLTATGRK